MVGEGQVTAASGQGDLRHVTTCAIRLRYWTGLCRLSGRRWDEWRGRGVARKALRII